MFAQVTNCIFDPWRWTMLTR